MRLKPELAFKPSASLHCAIMEGTAKSTERPQRRNRCGELGLLLSIVGIASIVLLGELRLELIRYMTISSLLGLVLSLVGLWWKPRQKAAWGLVIGTVGSLYLPTIFLPVLRSLRLGA
jgi:hypothetical protein